MRVDVSPLLESMEELVKTELLKNVRQYSLFPQNEGSEEIFE